MRLARDVDAQLAPVPSRRRDGNGFGLPHPNGATNALSPSEQRGEDTSDKARHAKHPKHGVVAGGIVGARAAGIVRVADGDVGNEETRLLQHRHQAVGRAKLFCTDIAGDGRPEHSRHERETYAEQHCGQWQPLDAATQREEGKRQRHGANGEQQREMAEPIQHQAEDRRDENGGQKT